MTSKAEVEQAFEDEMRQSNLCGLGKIMAEAGENGDVIREKVNDQVHYSAAVIARVLKRLGMGPISAQMIVTHRKGECRCKDR